MDSFSGYLLKLSVSGKEKKTAKLAIFVGLCFSGDNTLVNKTLRKGKCSEGRKWGDAAGTVGASGGRKPIWKELSGRALPRRRHVCGDPTDTWESSLIWGQSP